MHANLIPLDGSTPIPITRELMVVGRKRGLCDVVIDHSSISKIHCAIAMTDGLLFIRDLGSTNGTKVNGQRVIRGALLPNDELSFAKFRFKVSMGPGDNPPDPHDRTEVILRMPNSQKENFKTATDTDT
jgi:pSer/pThr/pTyr-binding forkhead associated (FHA) protein